MSVIPLAVTVAALMAMLAAAAVIARVARLPSATSQLAVGFVTATVAVSLGFDTGLRYWNYHDLVLYLLLPIVVFEAAYRTDVRIMRRHAGPIALLASAGLVVTFGLVAGGLHIGVNHPSFTWPAAFLAAAIVCATDPSAITSHVANDASQRVRTVLEGESHFNDGTSVVLFTTVSAIALGESTSAFDGLLLFGRDFLGGIAVGLVVGIGLRLGTRWIDDQQTRHWLVIAVVLVAHAVANEALRVSGVMVCLVAGLAFSSSKRADNDSTWSFLGNTSTGVIFILAGATITSSMFVERWLAMVLAVVSIVLARMIAVTGLLSLIRSGSWKERVLLGGIGSRGAVTLALALMLPTDLWYWWTLQSAAYGVVLFDLCIVAPLAPMLSRRLSEQPHDRAHGPAARNDRESRS